MTLRRKCNGAKHGAEAAGPRLSWTVGERSLRDEGQSERKAGLQGSDYAGMSNVKTGGKPVRRKPKVSWVKLIFPG